MGFVKDFYNIPEYGLLLPPAQTALSNYVVEGKGTAKEALDSDRRRAREDPEGRRLPEVSRPAEIADRRWPARLLTPGLPA